jgi:Fe-S-cluster containining protein
MSADIVASTRLRAQTSVADALRLPDALTRAGDAQSAACRSFEETWSRARPDVERAGPIACTAGCAACCHQHVAVHAIEAVAIAAHLGREDCAALRARLAATDSISATMDPPTRRRARLPCAFLDRDGSCAIYAVRPLRCRGVHARDATLCLSQTEDPDAAAAERARRVGDHPAFPREPVRIADAALAGLAAAAAERGIARESLELGRAVTLLLAEPARAAAVMAGIDDLAAARLDLAQRPVAGP